MSETKNASTMSKNSDIWQTIDDVNATFDSISLISGGKPTKTGESVASALSVQDINDNLNNFIDNRYDSLNCDGYYTLEDSDDTTNGAYGGEKDSVNYMSEFEKQAHKDAILHAELSEIFPYNYSNVAIERHWGSNVKEHKDESDEPLIDVDDKELLEIEEQVKYLSLHDKNTDIESCYVHEVEARICSPPIVDLPSTSEKSCESPTLSGSILSNSDHLANNNNNLLDTVETLNSDEDNGLSTLTPDTITNAVMKLINDQEVIKPKLPKKKCRNALLNGLYRRKLLAEKSAENSSSSTSSVVLKTPDDFLNRTTTSINSNYFADVDDDDNNTQSSKCKTFNYFFQNNSNIDFHEENNSDNFKYRPEDFPAL
ncbi:hypothetical protein O3M35_013065 [Rhynocoris fuscipes]|uniref:Uncharacterized protein n=1 Tax=Rhynocoris fuscipes TaxID=488301 RepID=A0AAW1CE57_9HEMI